MVPKRTAMDWVFEFIALAGLLGVFSLLIAYWSELPAEVPMHFGASGLPNRWGNKNGLLIFPLTVASLYVSLTVASRYQKFVNLPIAVDRDALEVRQLLLSMTIALKMVMVLSFDYIEWATLNTALGRSEGLGYGFLPLLLSMTFIPIVFYLLKLRRYRRP